jgi:hypothetical protein
VDHSHPNVGAAVTNDEVDEGSFDSGFLPPDVAQESPPPDAMAGLAAQQADAGAARMRRRLSSVNAARVHEAGEGVGVGVGDAAREHRRRLLQEDVLDRVEGDGAHGGDAQAVPSAIGGDDGRVWYIFSTTSLNAF